MEIISIIFPTRNRPHNCNRIINSVKETISNERLNSIEFCLYIDDDDIITIPELENLKNLTNINIKYIQGPRICLSKMWNEAYEKLANGNIIMHCGDDIIFRTNDWDIIVRNKFNEYEDKLILVFGRDEIHNERFGTHSFLHRNWIETSGFWLPPYFSSDYNDTWLNDVALMINRRIFIDNLCTEHMHFTVNKAEIDQNTLDRLDRHRSDDVEKIYAEKKDERNNHANLLLNKINLLKS
jgi:hypothetical protein